MTRSLPLFSASVRKCFPTHPPVSATRNTALSGWLLIMLLLGVSTLSQGQCFNAVTNFAVGSAPYLVVKGDFNTDGKPDLVIVNTEDNTISILLNNGSGGFGPATDFSVGSSPRSAAVGDFNGDGKLDLITANATNTVSVLLGDGNGGFTASSVNVPGIPLSVAVGDFNNDGKLDLVTGTYSSGAVTLIPGNGSGGFGNQTSFSVGHQPTSIASGDFNGDGKPDLVTSNVNTDKLSVLLNNGSGGFGPASDITTGGVAYSVALGDFNGDGKSDLATANYDAKTVSVLLGTGTGSFGSATNFGLAGYPNSPVVGDFDTDGKLDLAVVYAGGQVSVLLGTGIGGFGPETTFSMDIGSGSMVAGDLNGDGRVDLATGNYYAKSVSIRLNCAGQLLNTAPTVANAIPGQQGAIGQPFSLVIPATTFTDAETPNTLTLSVAGLPPGLSFNATSTISGLPGTVVGSPFTVLVTATDPGGLSVSTSFALTIQAGPVVNQPLQLLQPLYDCQSGVVTFVSVGGDGSAVEYRAIGVTNWTTNPNQVLDAAVRQDANSQPIPMQARQGQTMVSYSFDWRGYCTNGNPVSNQAPVFHGPLASVTGSIGSGFDLFLPGSTFTDPDAGDVLTYTAANLPTGLVLNQGNSLEIVGQPTTPGTYVVTLTATDPGGLMAAGTLTIVITNGGQPPAGALSLIQPLYNCQTGALTFQTSGGNGTPVSFFCVGVTGGSTQASYVLEAAIRNDVNSQPLTIQATQSGVTVSYVFDWRGYCGQARMGVAEVIDTWTLRSLGNPVTSEVVVELTNATGQPVGLSLVNLMGQVVETRMVTPATGQHREVFDVTGQGAGMLLLRAESASRTQTLKLLKR